MKKIKRDNWIPVNNKLHSVCSSSKLSELDFYEWWSDHFFAPVYIHVSHENDGTSHRVFPKSKRVNGIAMKDGILYWTMKP